VPNMGMHQAYMIQTGEIHGGNATLLEDKIGKITKKLVYYMRAEAMSLL